MNKNKLIEQATEIYFTKIDPYADNNRKNFKKSLKDKKYIEFFIKEYSDDNIKNFNNAEKKIAEDFVNILLKLL